MKEDDGPKKEEGLTRRDALKAIGTVTASAAATARGAASSAQAAELGATPPEGSPQILTAAFICKIQPEFCIENLSTGLAPLMRSTYPR